MIGKILFLGLGARLAWARAQKNPASASLPG
jgi:hypothetical protein